jgi:transcriptional regulator with XRE-family HTH domain
MIINIGENLRRLRLKKDLTQEQLAEVFGVSPQAISRWENNTAYPDITMLPGIAIYYNTTIDELVGMDEIRKNENIGKLHSDVHRLVGNNLLDEAIVLLKEGLKLYPNNSGLLLALASTPTQKSNKINDVTLIEEAISLTERALQGNLVMKSRTTATVNLLFLYLKLSKTEKANELIKSLPHIWESREIIMPELYDGDEYIEKLKESITKALVLLCGKINGLQSRKYAEAPSYLQLGVDFQINENIDEMLNLIGDFLKRVNYA